jgi:hypothetical protein
VNSITKFGAGATPVLSCVSAGVVAGVRRTVAPVSTVQGTGVSVAGPSVRTLDRIRLPFAGIGARLVALDVYGVMGADQVEATVVRIPAADDKGIPPRRTPSRC